MMQQKDQKTELIQQSARQEKKVKLKRLNSSQSSLLKSTVAGVSGVSMGALLMSVITMPSNANDEVNLDEMTEGVEQEVVLHTNAPFSDVVTDDMSFSEAFAAARADVGAGGFFEWHGESFQTYYKEEWDALNADGKNHIFEMVDENHSEAEISEEQEILDILNDNTEEIEAIEIIDDTEDIVINNEINEEDELFVIDDSEEDGLNDENESSGDLEIL